MDPETKGGSIKIPRKVGITRMVPKMYQGALFPILELVLSLMKPTMGVVIPSAIYPESITKAAVVESSPITAFT